MNPYFLNQVGSALAVERLEAYRQDGAEPRAALARYLLNLALCESLYSPLHLAEVALRNALHHALSVRYGTESWYDASHVPLTPWQQATIADAQRRLIDRRKPITAGRVVAELTFGFWVSFFNKWHARSGLGFFLVKHAFQHAPREERDLAKLDARWEQIRALRNRVFHHERIVHYTDLEAQHADIVRVIGWISPELHELVHVLDRFSTIRQGGLRPWLDQFAHHWPHATPVIAPATASPAATVVSVPEPFAAWEGVETPFGHRWGGDVFRLSPAHLAELYAGKTLALDVQNEYVAFLTTAGKGGSHGG